MKLTHFLSFCQASMSFSGPTCTLLLLIRPQRYKKFCKKITFTTFFSLLFSNFVTKMKQKQHQVLICLASNIDQKQYLEKAREQLSLLINDMDFTTEHWTEPVNSIRKEPYLNQLCKGTTTFGANLLSELLKEMEKRLGRKHEEDGIVTIDIDLLQYDEQRYHLRDWERIYVKDLLSKL